ncbi:MAG TPA: DUF1992 domain-containing protein [Thermoanaerobaculia bacterium]|jgi:hypothetical protein|nr:DUF1992 domain-containing protein [Thermoanaerobaculia bacterium]
MSQDRFTRRAIERISENRIQTAIEEGQFDNLPGFGKPIPDIDEPYDPMWWVRQWVRREGMSRVLAEGLRRTDWK